MVLYSPNFRISSVCSGSAIQCPNNTLAVLNLSTGVDVYNMPPTRLLRSFTFPIVHNVRLQLATLYEGEYIISGSDVGRPRVINQATGSYENDIPHGIGIVQALAVSCKTR